MIRTVSKGGKNMEANNPTKKERFTTYLPTKLIENFRELSDDSRIPQARLFEEAVEDLLKKYNVKV